MTKVDPLIQALLDCESRLTDWLNASQVNAEWFRRDPLTAMRAANLGMDEGLLCDMEEMMAKIALKFRAA